MRTLIEVDTRPVLLGLNNKLSDSPKMALWPDPPGSAGWRIWKMIGCSQEDYIRGFDRRNLHDSIKYASNDTRVREIWKSLDERRVIVLGSAALKELLDAQIFDKRPPWILPQHGDGPMEWRL